LEARRQPNSCSSH